MTNKTIDILPAVLPNSFKILEEHLAPLQDVVRYVQIDVVDGVYAKGKTWPYRESDTFVELVAEEHGLPFWDKLDFQFDLMIDHPELVLKEYLQAGASQVVLHAKAQGVIEALQILVDRRTNESGVMDIKAGIAIGLGDDLEILETFDAQFDFVQVMGIEHIGKQGEPFDKRALYLVERVRARYPQLPIQVDGGVSKENAYSLVQAGANRLVVGSAIFGADDPLLAYKELVALANQ